ncbi:hypothetical protein O181_014598 [Austropuccinia psidii MF-1]|uniref:Uncharacterized protein n=1 Tax=Austropuccinia psidii MF-1 TaxID=1389203 RepID=A0A9Q3C1J4_9BASI|nr:hypothetical protein [Austropuccinia psidii MF-1]
MVIENSEIQNRLTSDLPLQVLPYFIPPQKSSHTANKSLCKHIQDSQTFLVTPTKEMEYNHIAATKMTVFVDNAKQLLILESGSHCSIVAKEYLEMNFSNW